MQVCEKDTVAEYSEEGVNLWRLDGREDESLPVEVAPLVQSPKPHTREVNSVRFAGRPVQVREDMLGGGGGGGWLATFIQPLI